MAVLPTYSLHSKRDETDSTDASFPAGLQVVGVALTISSLLMLAMMIILMVAYFKKNPDQWQKAKGMCPFTKVQRKRLASLREKDEARTRPEVMTDANRHEVEAHQAPAELPSGHESFLWSIRHSVLMQRAKAMCPFTKARQSRTLRHNAGDASRTELDNITNQGRHEVEANKYPIELATGHESWLSHFRHSVVIEVSEKEEEDDEEGEKRERELRTRSHMWAARLQSPKPSFQNFQRRTQMFSV